MRTDETLDSIVDEVARRMTEEAPGDDFTLKVMRRVADPPGQGRRRARFVLAPLAAAAALAIVIFGARAAVDQRQVKATPPSPAASTTRPEGRSGTESPSPDLIAQTATAEAARPDTIRMTTAQMGTRAAPARRASPIEPMTVPLLHTPPLTIEAIPADPIAVDRLEPIPLLAVPPLATDDDQRRRE
jgi:hypothetical protein